MVKLKLLRAFLEDMWSWLIVLWGFLDGNLVTRWLFSSTPHSWDLFFFSFCKASDKASIAFPGSAPVGLRREDDAEDTQTSRRILAKFKHAITVKRHTDFVASLCFFFPSSFSFYSPSILYGINLFSSTGFLPPLSGTVFTFKMIWHHVKRI